MKRAYGICLANTVYIRRTSKRSLYSQALISFFRGRQLKVFQNVKISLDLLYLVKVRVK